MTWDDLEYWSSKDWQTVQEKLDALEQANTRYCPDRSLLFRSLDACPLGTVRVCIMGQDPYPDPRHACGLAFSVPRGLDRFPPTLLNIFKELKSDLGLESQPKTGDLLAWANQGVLLWNAVPTCLAHVPGSHRNWVEWDALSMEIVKTLSDKGIVFGLLGGWARKYIPFIDQDANEIIYTAHPSPRAAINAKAMATFQGSRFFTTINIKLKEMSLEPIDWRL